MVGGEGHRNEFLQPPDGPEAVQGRPGGKYLMGNPEEEKWSGFVDDMANDGVGNNNVGRPVAESDTCYISPSWGDAASAFGTGKGESHSKQPQELLDIRPVAESDTCYISPSWGDAASAFGMGKGESHSKQPQELLDITENVHVGGKDKKPKGKVARFFGRVFRRRH
jgi:hypothetical protein